jgi:hypothetical protein
MKILENKKKFFLFDWDDNILNMPTQIILDKLIRNSWVKISLDSKEFRKIRKNIGKNYRIRKDSFKHFKGKNYFQKDLIKSVNDKKFGPVFKKFLFTLCNCQDFAIITARGHSPDVVKKGILYIIKNVMTPTQKRQLMLNLNNETLEEYLSRQKYRTISSPEFVKEFGLNIGSQSPEEGKKLALTHYIEDVVNKTKNFRKISVGFSDDDIGNIKAIESIIKKELKKKFPKINFVIYDTSNPKKIKKKRIL